MYSSYCRNICLNYGIKLPCKKGKAIHPYQEGLKYCRRCELYFDTNLISCLCCGQRLRQNPINKNLCEVKRY